MVLSSLATIRYGHSFVLNYPQQNIPIPIAYVFQYFTSSTSNVRMEKRNFLILIRFHNNLCNNRASCLDYIPTLNCRWLPKSSFNNMIALEVNDYYMQFVTILALSCPTSLNKVHSVCVLMNYIMTVTLMT